MSRLPIPSTTLTLTGQEHSGPESRIGALLGAVFSLLRGELPPCSPQGRRGAEALVETLTRGLAAWRQLRTEWTTA